MIDISLPLYVLYNSLMKLSSLELLFAENFLIINLIIQLVSSI